MSASMDSAHTVRERDRSSGQSVSQLKRPDSPEPSCVSIKSDVSMELPNAFKEGEHTSGNSVTQIKRSDSPEPSCVSMKSEASMDLPYTFKDGKPSSGNSVLQKARSRKDQRIITESGCDPPSAGTDVQERCKLTLLKKFQHVHEVINQGNPTLLNEIYTELYITEGDSGKVNNEHEVVGLWCFR